MFQRQFHTKVSNQSLYLSLHFTFLPQNESPTLVLMVFMCCRQISTPPRRAPSVTKCLLTVDLREPLKREKSQCLLGKSHTPSQGLLAYLILVLIHSSLQSFYHHRKLKQHEFIQPLERCLRQKAAVSCSKDLSLPYPVCTPEGC